MTCFIFFTGGYDSTYRLCEAAIIEKKNVVPIYINDPDIDNEKGKRVKRRNNAQEITSQKKIIDKIKTKFPEAKKRIKNIVVYNEVPLDQDTKDQMKIIKDHSYVRRATCQYGAMAQITKNIKTPVEVCAEKGGHFEKKLKNKLMPNVMALDVARHTELRLFKDFRLPLFNMTKEDMLKKSHAHGFDDILMNSWSCWYPKKGKPCGRCIMCKERIVPFVEGFQNVKESMWLLDLAIVINLILIGVLFLRRG